MARLLNCIRI